MRSSIRDMILSGEIKSGSKLVQQDIAANFGVAQGVVREALLELEPLGLTQSIDNRGIFVREISPKMLLESLEIREVHEGLAVRLCCEHVTRSQIRELMKLVDECSSFSLIGDLDEIGRIDRKLHQRLMQLSGNNMLIRLAEHHQLLGKVVSFERDPEEVRREHISILEAIGQGNADKAEQLMRQHIRTAKNILEKKLEEGTFTPKWTL